MGKLDGDGYRIERNVSSSEAIDPSSKSESESEVYSDSSCDDFLGLGF